MAEMKTIAQPMRRLCRLYKEEALLKLTEKTTRILSGIYVTLIVSVLAVLGLVFASIGIADELSQWMSPTTSMMVVGGGYLLIAVIVVICRRSLVVNPISRFLSRIILQPPKCAEK